MDFEEFTARVRRCNTRTNLRNGALDWDIYLFPWKGGIIVEGHVEGHDSDMVYLAWEVNAFQSGDEIEFSVTSFNYGSPKTLCGTEFVSNLPVDWPEKEGDEVIDITHSLLRVYLGTDTTEDQVVIERGLVHFLFDE